MFSIHFRTVAALAAWAASAALISMPIMTTAALAATDVAADLRMAEDSRSHRQTADDFIAKAMAGNVAATQAMLSANLVARIGADGARQALQQQIVPFFVQGQQLGRSTTVTRTTDANGSSGFAFYLWLQPKAGGEALPFTVYVVDEAGRRVVANIVPNRLVPGRHQ